MYTDGNETEASSRARRAVIERGAHALSASPHPFFGVVSISRDIVASAEVLPDAELMRIAGCLRTMADEVMAIVNRRVGARPTPRLVVDNTPR